MKTTVLISLLLIVSTSAIGQQLLWSTVKKDDAKVIPYENVMKEVLEFYDLYQFYFDFSGYTKESFKEKLLEYSGFDKETWEFVERIEEKVSYAFRVPMEGGSAIFVLCIDKVNFHMVVFSNVYDSGANMTYNGEMEKDRERFIKWFKALLS